MIRINPCKADELILGPGNRRIDLKVGNFFFSKSHFGPYFTQK